MECPVCKEPMVVLEHDALEVDHCVECGGVWLDAGELELLFENAGACREFLAQAKPAAMSGEKPRRCPVCRRKMMKALSPGEPPVTYDLCSHGDGLWLDKGELELILAQAGETEGLDRVSGLLRGVFGPRST